MKKIAILIFLTILAFSPLMVNAQLILQGPKTIGRGWKDNIVLESRHFQESKAGDVLTVFSDQVRAGAQMAFQNPQDWQAISEAYKYVSVAGPVRMTISEEMLPVLRQHGLGIGGHDYRITYVTLTPAEAFEEKIVWRGPAVQMKPDWSSNAYIPASCLKNLTRGQALRLHVTKVEAGATVKISDFTWNPLSKAVEGAPVGGDSFTFYIDDDEPLIKLQLAGGDNDRAMIIGGKGYRLDKIGVLTVKDLPAGDNTSSCQQAPKEYILAPDELFHGEKIFPTDWSGNLRISAEKLQEATENDVLVISYACLPEAKEAVISVRENRGDWPDISGSKDPVWQPLDGNDYVLTFDASALDKVKTKGFVITGQGFVLKRIQLITAE